MPPELSNVPPQALEVSRRMLSLLLESSLGRGLFMHIRNLQHEAALLRHRKS